MVTQVVWSRSVARIVQPGLTTSGWATSAARRASQVAFACSAVVPYPPGQLDCCAYHVEVKSRLPSKANRSTRFGNVLAYQAPSQDPAEIPK